MGEEILYETQDGVARITINRPERLNAFTMQGVERLLGAFRTATDDPAIGVVVLTGAGDRAFCTGGDVGDFEAFTVAADRAMSTNLLRLSQEMRQGGKPVIARVNGYCIGAGNELNMQCDLTIAVEDAKFGQTGPKVGSSPNWWVTQLLPRSVGEKRAREIVYLCRQYTAAEAVDMGWVNAVVPRDQLDATVDAWCAEILAKSPTALRLAKMAINQGADSLHGAVTQAMELITFFHDTDESREGMRAFMEKRRPEFDRFRS